VGLVLHVPPLHALPAAHAFAQPPQCAVSLVVSTHAPLQSVRPAPQVAVHIPALQTAPVPHEVPQLPQFLGSLEMSTQSSPHAVRPAGHPEGMSIVEPSVGRTVSVRITSVPLASIDTSDEASELLASRLVTVLLHPTSATAPRTHPRKTVSRFDIVTSPRASRRIVYSPRHPHRAIPAR
jgi:hypothetical protein